MSIPDLLFIVVFLASIACVGAAAFLALRRRTARSLRILRGWSISIVLYFGVVAVVSLLSPRRVVAIGEPQCFDDWCITVENVQAARGQSKTSYTVTLGLSSRARRVSQRENGVVVYLTDRAANRYDPDPVGSPTPFNVLLQPMESITTTRIFTLPLKAEGVAVVVAHEGSFPIGWFILGEGPFQKSAVVYVGER
jgi:hypothetical protein